MKLSTTGPARHARSGPGAGSRRRHRARLRPVRRHGRRNGRVHPHRVRGLAFNLEENSVGVIILGDYLEIAEGDEVAHAPAQLLRGAGRRRRDRPRGRSAGQSAGRQGPDRHRRIAAAGIRSLPASPAGSRSTQPLQTGIKAIDAMTPIGRGQRELIIGDRKTGKTAIAIDTIINQKEENVICVYVAIGQKESTVAGVVESAARARRDGLHHRRRRLGRRPGPAAIHRPLRRLRDGRVLHVRAGPRHAVRLRRPDEAGRRLSPVVAADAAAARPRGLSRRRLLLPLAPARTLGQAGRALGHRAGRRRRQAGRRRLGRQRRKSRTASGQGLRRPARQGARREARR